MATVSIPDLLKAAERPLALFLDDALRSIDARYFDRFVRPYVATASPDYPGKRVFSGNERLRDSRNQDKTSFLDCDLLFLTHYFEFATDYESWRDANERPLPMTSMGKVEFPNLTRVFPFTQKGIVTKIAAVRELRNQWSHGHTDEADVHHLSIDISKLLDLFKVEIQHVVQERPGSFRPETKLAVDGYVEKLKAALKGTSAVAPTNTTRHLADSVKSRFNSLFEKSLARVSAMPRKWINGLVALIVVAGCVWAGVAVVSNMGTDDSDMGVGPIQSPIHILALEPVPEHLIERVKSQIKLSLGQAMHKQIAVYAHNYPEGIVVHDSELHSSLTTVATSLMGVTKLNHALEFGALYRNAIESLRSQTSKSSKPILIVVGSIGSFTAAEIQEYKTNPTTLFPDGTETYWTLTNTNPIYFLRLGKSTLSDKAVLDGLQNKQIRTQVVESY
ncbi:MAG: hypothetical protein IPF59_08160 [Ignavibacteria bacterium]|nr:hypothetical protein [Ignavibacteria bacterium]MBK6420305.1 hypothetical protein [Ignavibacteria bacterium]